MTRAITSTTSLIYLYRIGALEFLPKLFDVIWMPSEVYEELQVGRYNGYDFPNPLDFEWLEFQDPREIPPDWETLDLGTGELHAMALVFENIDSVVLLDDVYARRIVQPVGIVVWGTLKVLLEARSQGYIKSLDPYLDRMSNAGMWLSDEVRKRILKLSEAGNVPAVGE